jgi:hypothetical protein
VDGLTNIVELLERGRGRAVIEAWQRSGEPGAVFARRHGVSYWRAKLEARSEAPIRSGVGGFVAVSVRGAAPILSEVPERRVEVTLPNGRVVGNRCTKATSTRPPRGGNLPTCGPLCVWRCGRDDLAKHEGLQSHSPEPALVASSRTYGPGVGGTSNEESTALSSSGLRRRRVWGQCRGESSR